MTDYAALLAHVAGRPVRADLAAAIQDQLPRYGIDATTQRLAYFVAETAEESGGFRYLHELGNAAYFARYDGRADLGNTQPGDGARFSGAGLIELTGRANFARYGARLGVDLVGHPELAQRPDIAVATACLFWIDHGLNELADADNLVAVTRRINGGLNGLAERRADLTRAKTFLAGPGGAAAQPAPIPPPAAPVAPLAPPEPPAASLLDPAPDPTPTAPPVSPLDKWIAYGHRAMAGAAGVVATIAAFFHDHPLEAVLLAALAVLIVLVVIRWTNRREAHHAEQVQDALNTPAPTQPQPSLLTGEDIARIAEAVAAIRTAA